jgi:putative ATP-binding cassette transporter
MSLKIKFDSALAFIGEAFRLSRPYFESDEKWRARGLLAAIVLLNLGAVGMLVLINDWNRLFYDALQNKDAAVFWDQLGRFTYLAFGFIVIAVYKFYLTQLLELRWRAWMTRQLLGRWLSKQAFYTLELTRFSAALPDNPDQRIQEDVAQFTNLTVSLSMGLLNSVVTLLSFVGILWSLSGGFAFTLGGHDWDIPGFMVWMALLYCVAGSVITHLIGRPLIGLNFEQQRREADFRHHLIRVREYSEAIALDRGAATEEQQLDLRFGSVLTNTLQLLKAQKSLTWFTSGFGQAAVVFPFIVAAPRFFSGAIQLGELMQIASAFGRVQDALSWFVESYDRLASWRATTERLTSFEATLARLEATTSGIHQRQALPEGLQARGLSVRLPNGQTLMGQLDVELQAGDRVLVQGPSGSGKSTLFRGLAGIWPYSTGELALPQDAMFVPQHPYFPQGSLRLALTYPQAPHRYNDAELQTALTHALLPHLSAQLDVQAAWGQTLSGGEQQRLALARVFLRQPAWVFADEATSALDEAAEQTLYQRLTDMVQGRGGLVSIAHRPSLLRFHNRIWQLEAQPAGDQTSAGLALYRLTPRVV